MPRVRTEIPDAEYERILTAPHEVTNVDLAAELDRPLNTVWRIRTRRERRAIRIARRLGIIQPYDEPASHPQHFDDQRAYVVAGKR